MKIFYKLIITSTPKSYIAIYLLLMFLLVLFDFITMYFFNFLLNAVSGNEFDYLSATIYTDLLFGSIRILFFTTVLIILFRFLFFRFNLIAQNLIVNSTYGYYFNMLLTSHLEANYDKKKLFNTDVVNNLLLKDLRVFSQTYILLGLDLILQYFTLLVFVITLAWTNILLLIGIFIIGIIVTLVSRYYKKINISNGKDLLAVDSTMTVYIRDSNSNYKSVFVNSEILSFHLSRVTTLFNSVKSILNRMNLNSTMTQKIVESVILLSICFLLFMISEGLFSFNEFVFVSVIVVRIMPILNRINAAQSKINNSENIANYLYEKLILFTATESEIKALKIYNDVKINKVLLQLAKNKSVALNNIYLEPGKSYILNGKSGSGKTSFVDNFVGYRSGSEISIQIDGSSTWDFDYKLANVIYVEQKMTLFSGGIIENITLNRKFQQDLFIEIIDVVGLRKVFLERGILSADGKIEDIDSASFSGGEVQRILIGRALYNMDCLLVFDEASNALDNESEIFLVQNLIKFVRKRKGIILYISHNPAVLNLFDRVIDFEKV